MEKEAKESARETLAARALKILGVIKYDKDCHTIIDVSLLQSLPENEMLRCRGVGKITLGMILELNPNRSLENMYFRGYAYNFLICNIL